MKLLNGILSKLSMNVSDDAERKRKQLLLLELIIGAISTIMSLMNIFTHKTLLLVSTAAMAVLSFGNAWIIYRTKKDIRLGTVIFTAKMMLLFNYFIIFGGTEGFSIIWLLLTPACAPFAFGRKKGGSMSLILLLELVLLFYTPLGSICIVCKDYTESFLSRFPILYTSFFFIGMYLEHIRESTHKEFAKLQKKVEFQSTHDQLTELNNRLGFQNDVEAFFSKNEDCGKYGFLILDVDFFKDINDEYGHMFGDAVLKEIADRIAKEDEGHFIACRWGGEEFAVFVKGNSCADLRLIAEKLRLDIARPMTLEGRTIHVTVSIGGVCSDEMVGGYSTDRLSDMFSISDRRLYDAKRLGRNRSVCSDSEWKTGK